MTAGDFSYTDYIERAKQTRGGHLYVGRGGFTLHFGTSWLSGYDCNQVKALCIGAGLPVIDGREASFDLVAKISVSGPMIAVARDPDPRPWHAFAYAPLEAVAAAYRRAGAEVFNIPEDDFDERGFAELTEPPLATLIDGWLAFVRRAAD
jgi:hypothetical protein